MSLLLKKAENPEFIFELSRIRKIREVNLRRYSNLEPGHVELEPEAAARRFSHIFCACPDPISAFKAAWNRLASLLEKSYVPEEIAMGMAFRRHLGRLMALHADYTFADVLEYHYLVSLKRTAEGVSGLQAWLSDDPELKERILVDKWVEAHIFEACPDFNSAFGCAEECPYRRLHECAYCEGDHSVYGSSCRGWQRNPRDFGFYGRE